MLYLSGRLITMLMGQALLLQSVCGNFGWKLQEVQTLFGHPPYGASTACISLSVGESSLSVRLA